MSTREDLKAQLEYESETLRIQHARKQSHADGFQSGWHAALTRAAEGDDVAELHSLVPVGPLDDAPVFVGAELDKARSEVTDWMLVADGVKHDPRCPNHFAGNGPGPCLRCQIETLRSDLAAALGRERALRELLPELIERANVIDPPPQTFDGMGMVIPRNAGRELAESVRKLLAVVSSHDQPETTTDEERGQADT